MSSFAPINPAELYPVAELQRRTGLGDKAIRLARRAEKEPLRVLFLHSRRFVLGADFIRYAEAHGVEDPPTAGTKGGAR